MLITEKMILDDFNYLGLLDNSEREKYLFLLKDYPQSLKYFKDIPYSKTLIDVSNSSLEFLDHKRLTEDEIVSILWRDGLQYQYLHPKRRANKRYIEAALNSNGNAIEFLPKSVPQTRELVEISFKSNKTCFFKIDYHLITRDMILDYIKFEPQRFSSICFDNNLKTLVKEDEEIIKLAIKCQGKNIRYIENQTIELCILALENNKDDDHLYSDINLVESQSNEEALSLLLEKQKLIELMSK